MAGDTTASLDLRVDGSLLLDVIGVCFKTRVFHKLKWSVAIDFLDVAASFVVECWKQVDFWLFLLYFSILSKMLHLYFAKVLALPMLLVMF